MPQIIINTQAELDANVITSKRNAMTQRGFVILPLLALGGILALLTANVLRLSQIQHNQHVQNAAVLNAMTQLDTNFEICKVKP